MKRHAKKLTALLCTAAMSAALLSGCSSGGDGQTADQAPAAQDEESKTEAAAQTADSAEQTAQPASDVVLELETTWTGEMLEGLQQIMDDFTAETGIGVEVISPGDDYENVMKTRMASGDLPDLWETHGWSTTRYSEYLTPLNDEPWVSHVKESIKKTVTDSQGNIYVVPLSIDPASICYNKDIFDEKGVEYPKEGWTWDEFMETAEKLTYEENGKTIYGYGLSSSYFQLTPWWATNSAYPVSEDYEKPALNSPAMLESITFLKSMVDKKVTPDPISSDVYTMFSSGQLAMVGAGRWVLNTWQDAGMKNFDCVQWPKKTEEGSVYGGSAWCIGSVTKEKELAVELLKEMVADETLTAVAAGGQQIPPTEKLACDTEIMGTVPDNILGLWKAVTIASPVAAPVFFGDIEQATLRGLENVFSGSMSVEDAMNQAQSEVETTIANK